MTDHLVSVETLGFAHPRSRPILDSVSFAIEAGSVVGILGRNGSGKTTLLRILAGVLHPTTGHVSIARLGERAIPPGRTSVVLDRTPFLDALGAAENLRITLRLRGRGVAADAQTLRRSLAIVGLDEDGDRPVREFSLGMRRRLALAEAFAAEPNLLLLDEPTLGLDPEGCDVLRAMLADAAGRGASAVVATNDAVFAEAACGEVLLLHEGRILVRGRPRDLISGLAAPTLLELQLVGPLPADDPPAGLSVVARGTESLTLGGTMAGRSVGAVVDWLEASGGSLRALRIREPDLGDVFRAHTGECLDVGEGHETGAGRIEPRGEG